MSNKQKKKLYLVKGNNNLYYPRLLTNNQVKNTKNIFKKNAVNPYVLQIVDKANDIFKKLQFKIRQENNNEWQNIFQSNLNNLNNLKIKVNGENIFLRNIFHINNPVDISNNLISVSKNPNNTEKSTYVNSYSSLNNPEFFKDLSHISHNPSLNIYSKKALLNQDLINLSYRVINEVSNLGINIKKPILQGQSIKKPILQGQSIKKPLQKQNIRKPISTHPKFKSNP